MAEAKEIKEAVKSIKMVKNTYEVTIADWLNEFIHLTGLQVEGVSIVVHKTETGSFVVNVDIETKL